MNVLRIIASMDPASGGPCQGVRNSIPELEKLGICNEVVCLDDPASSYLGNDVFPVHALGLGARPWCYSSRLMPWLLENFKRFDVIIIHGLWLYPSYAATKARELFNIRQSANKSVSKTPKIYIMPHGMLDPYFQKDPSRRLKALRNWIYWKIIESKVVNRAEGLLFTCEGELLLAKQPFRPYHPKKEINVGYGIQAPPPFEAAMTRAFLEKCPQVEAQQPYILFLSRIHEKKGVNLLIDAYAKVIDRLEKENADKSKVSFPKLVIAGPGLETSYGTKMQQMVSEHKILERSVFFPGMLTGKAKWGAFYGALAFILPSHQENFGIAIVEALACSKPVLISNKVNIWKEILSCNAGIINDDTVDGTISSLNNFFSLTPDERDNMGRQARLAYEKYFDVVAIAHHLIEAIS